MDGTLERVSIQRKGSVVRIERLLNNSAAEVWAAITEPRQLAQWLAKPSNRLDQRGAVDLHFENTDTTVHATVSRFEPPKALGLNWQDQTAPQTQPAAERRATGNGTCTQDLRLTRLLWVVNPVTNGTQLVLTHTIGTANRSRSRGRTDVDLPTLIASWQNHLDALTDTLSGGSISRRRGETWAWDRWADLKERYTQTIR
jgi:uncharacterized protein YndB with AHSA1/START domain